MKRTAIILIGIYIILSIPLSFAGSETGNGGGRAEQNFMFALLSLEKYFDACAGSEACGLTSYEKVALTSIKAELQNIPDRKTLLEFKSEKQNPGFFMVEGQLKIAKTGSKQGDKIFINEDLLYAQTKRGTVVMVDISEAAGVLTHELGHHHGLSSELALDLLGSKIRAFLLSNTAIIEHPMGANLIISNYAMNRWDTPIPANGFALPQVLVSNGETLTDLSNQIGKVLSCSLNDNAEVTTLYGVRITNAHWRHEYSGEFLPLVFQASLEYLCGSTPESAMWVYGDSQILVAFGKAIDARLITCWKEPGACN